MSVHLVRGDDASIVGQAVTDLVHRLVGDGDRALMVDELSGDEYELGAVVDAACTPPFLTERRVVVARGIRRFFARRAGAAAEAPTDDDEDDDAPDDADDEPAARPGGSVAPLLAYLASPVDTTDLVLESTGKGVVPKPLLDALKKAGGEVIDTTVKSTKDRRDFVDDHVATSVLKFDADARTLFDKHLGDDLARLTSVLEVLEATFAPGARLRADDVRPFLGEAGGVPPWDLTDAIDAGDIPRSLAVLDRMLGAGARHPLQVMFTLHAHYTRILRLDGSDAHSEAAAATLLRVSPFQAKKSLAALHRIGRPGAARAIEHLAAADLALRGTTDLDPSVVMEILVARLARLSPAPRRR